MAERPREKPLPRNVYALALVSLLNDSATEMIYPLLPAFLTSVLGASAGFIGAIEGAAESTAALLKLASGWWSDRVRRRKPLVVVGYGLATVVRPLVGFATTAFEVLWIRVTDRVGKGIRNSPRDALIAESVDETQRGRAFGVHAAGDNFGAFLGPVIAFALLKWMGLSLRMVFILSAVPGVLTMLVAIFGVKEIEHAPSGTSKHLPNDTAVLKRPGFAAYLVVILLFTLGNSTDAFLLLRAKQLGVSVAFAPILWALLNVVKSLSNVPGGTLSDRWGRRPTLVLGWIVYAAVYVAFGFARQAWMAWALFAAYGIYFGLTEGAERAVIADVVPSGLRGQAYGWYYLAVGVAALPASIVFGVVWDRFGATAAFAMGAALALAAAIGMAMLPMRTPADQK